MESKRLFQELSKTCGKHSGTNVVLLGDFNYPSVDWKHKRFSGDSHMLEMFIKYCQMQQHVTELTRENSTLDLVFTHWTNDCDVTVQYLPPIGNSDHVSLSVEISSAINSIKSLAVAENKPPNTPRYNYALADWRSVRDCLTSSSWNDFMASTNVDEAWQIFRHNMLAAVEPNVPKVVMARCKGHKNPWLRNEDLTFLAQKKFLGRPIESPGSEKDLLAYKQSRNYAATKLKLLRRRFGYSLVTSARGNADVLFKNEGY